MNSLQTTKQLLWNVLEPGDPYDIRKSLITKIPGDKKIFMGDNLQMVCLFQAVEIERLMEYLTDSQLKYKEIQRRELDRHYYEIQIKQLTQMNADSESLRIEVSKLKQFIRRQTQELELQRKNNKYVDETLDKKYMQALNELQILVEKNQQMMQELSISKGDLNNWKSRYQALDRSRQKQIDQLKGQNQKHFLLDKQLKQINNKFSIERNQFEVHINRLKEQIDNKNMQIEDWQLQFSNYNRSVNERQNQIRGNIVSEYEIRQGKFKQQIEYLNELLTRKSIEVQQLSIKNQVIQNQLRSYNDQSNELSIKVREDADEINKLNISIHQLQLKLNQNSGINHKFEDAQNKIALLSQEIARLQYMSVNKSKELEDANSIIKKFQYDYESLRRDHFSLINKLNDLQKSKSSLYDLQSSMTKITNQNNSLKDSLTFHQDTNKRLGLELQKLQSQSGQNRRQLDIIRDENSHFRAKINELTFSLQNSSRLNDIVVDLQNKIRLLESQKQHLVQSFNHLQYDHHQQINQYKNILQHERSRNSISTQQIEQKMKAMTDSHEERVRAISKQLQMSKKSNIVGQQHQNSIIRLKDSTQKIYEWEARYHELQIQRDKLNQIAHELQERLRSVGTEERLVRCNQQIQRLGKMLMEKDEQIYKYVSILKQSDQYRIKYENSILQIQSLRNEIYNHQVVYQKEYELKISHLHKEIDQLKRHPKSEDSNGKTLEYESRLRVLTEENQGLRNQLSLGSNNYNQLQNQFRKISIQRQQLNIIAHDLQQKLRETADQSELTVLKTKIVQYESIHNKYSSQVQKLNHLNRRLQDNNTLLNQEIIAHKTKIQNLILQIDQLKRTQSNNDHLHQEYQFKFSTFSKEIERLNMVLRSKVEECERLSLENRQTITRQNQKVRLQQQSSLQNIQIANQQSRRHIQNIKLLHIQVQKLEEELRTTNNALYSLQNQNDLLKTRLLNQEINMRRISQFQLQIHQTSRQLQQTNQDNSDLNDRLRILTSQYEKVSSELRVKQIKNSQITQLTTESNQKIIFYTKDNQRLKSLYQDSLKHNSQLQLTVQKLKNQLDLLSIKLRDVQGFSIKQERLRLQIQRLVQSVIVKQSEINNLQRSVSQLQIANQKFINLGQQLQKFRIRNTELVSKISDYENKMFSNSSQIQGLRTRLQFSEDKVKRMNQIQNREIIALREKDSKIDDLNRQIVEYKQKMIMINNDHTFKITSYQNDYSFLKQQNQRLNRSIGDAISQMNRFQQDNERLKVQMNRESQYKLQSQIETFQSKSRKYEFKIESTTKQNQSLKREIQQNQFQIRELNSKIRSSLFSEEELQRLRLTISEFDIQREGYQSRLLALGNQIERLNGVLRSKVQQTSSYNTKYNLLISQINSYKQNISQLTIENQSLSRSVSEMASNLEAQTNSRFHQYQVKIQQLNKKIFDYENQVTMLHQEIQRLEKRIGTEKQKHKSQIQQKLNQCLVKIANYQDRILKLSAENQRLDIILKSKLDVQTQLSSTKIENDKLSQALKIKIDAEEKVAVYLKQIQRLNNTLRLKVQESKQMEKKFSSLENDAKIAKYSHQIERLNNSLRLKIDQNKKWQEMHSQISKQLDSTREKYNQVVREYEHTRRKYLEMQEKFPRLNAEFENFSRIVRSLKEQLALQKQQNYNLSVRLGNGSVQVVQQKNRMLAIQIQRLKKIINQLQVDISELRLRYVDQNALQKRIKEHLGLFVVLFAEIESLRRRVKDKEKQVEQVRRSSLAPYIVVPPN